MMIKIALAGLRARRLRLLLTTLAVTLGVGFITGTFVLTDAMQAGYSREFAASADKVDVAVFPPKGTDDTRPRLPVDLLAKIRTLPGVADARGTVRGDAPLLGKDGRSHGDGTTVGLSLPADGPLRRYAVVSGRVPAAADEAALDEGVAKDTGFKPGDHVQVLDPDGTARTFRLVGIVDLGVDTEVSIRGGVAFGEATAARMTGRKGYVEIDVAGSVTADQVRAAIGPGYEVLTGERLGTRLAKSNGTDTGAVMAGLLAFGMIALLVAGLVIYNTFTILVAQRARELALLRCLGATRRQVFGGVVVESALVGLVGSLVGLAFGVGLGFGGLALLNAFGADVPTGGGGGLSPRTVGVALFVGVAMTMISALPPARRATKVAPLAALRTEPEPGERSYRLGLPRWVVTALFGGLGLALAGLGLLGMDPGEAAMFTVAGGGVLVFVAVVAIMPLLVRPLGRLVGAPPARIAGLPGRLAVQNVRRAPGRTATTTIALTVGVGLVSLFAVVGASSKATADHMLRDQFPVDYRLHTGAVTDRTVPRAVAAELRSRQGEFSEVAEVRSQLTGFGTAGTGSRRKAVKEYVGTVTPSALGGVMRPEMKHGSLNDLRSGTVMVGEEWARRQQVTVGRRLTLQTRQGPVQVTVAAMYEGAAFLLPEVVVPEADFDRYFRPGGATAVYLNIRPGADATAARAAIDAAIRSYPIVKVSSATAMKAEFDQAINTLLAVFAALLGLAILIALFGITNTLTLSVVERTRESALLRALGVTKRQLRGMLSVEAVIMSLIGALVGVLLGGVFGWAATKSLSSSFVFALPYGQIALFIALAGMAGLLAAVFPARRAAKASIVESLAAGES